MKLKEIYTGHVTFAVLETLASIRQHEGGVQVQSATRASVPPAPGSVGRPRRPFSSCAVAQKQDASHKKRCIIIVINTIYPSLHT